MTCSKKIYIFPAMVPLLNKVAILLVRARFFCCNFHKIISKVFYLDKPAPITNHIVLLVMVLSYMFHICCVLWFMNNLLSLIINAKCAKKTFPAGSFALTFVSLFRNLNWFVYKPFKNKCWKNKLSMLSISNQPTFLSSKQNTIICLSESLAAQALWRISYLVKRSKVLSLP